MIDSVVELLNEKKKGWEADAEDRALRSYSETIDVHQMFHPKIIGQKVAFTFYPPILIIFRALLLTSFKLISSCLSLLKRFQKRLQKRFIAS